MNPVKSPRIRQDLDQCQLNESSVLRPAAQLGETALHLAQSYPEYFPKGRPRWIFHSPLSATKIGKSYGHIWKTYMELKQQRDVRYCYVISNVIYILYIYYILLYIIYIYYIYIISCLFRFILFFATKMIDFGSNLGCPSSHDVTSHSPLSAVMAGHGCKQCAEDCMKTFSCAPLQDEISHGFQLGSRCEEIQPWPWGKNMWNLP